MCFAIMSGCETIAPYGHTRLLFGGSQCLTGRQQRALVRRLSITRCIDNYSPARLHCCLELPATPANKGNEVQAHMLLLLLTAGAHCRKTVGERRFEQS